MSTTTNLQVCVCEVQGSYYIIRAQMFTRRERQKSANSLVCLLQALAGQCTRLELRNEIAITGTVISVDCNMKLVSDTHFRQKLSSFPHSTMLRNAETEKLNVSISRAVVNNAICALLIRGIHSNNSVLGSTQKRDSMAGMVSCIHRLSFPALPLALP